MESVIYIANCTKQTLELNFRRKEKLKGGDEFNENDLRAESYHIPSGHNLAIKTCKTRESMEHVVNFLVSVYGFVKYGDIHRPRTFSGFVYSTDRPVSEDMIRSGHEKVVEQQEGTSLQVLQTAANVMDNQLKVNGRRLAKVSNVEILELDNPHDRSSNKPKRSTSVSVEEGGKKRGAR